MMTVANDGQCAAGKILIAKDGCYKGYFFWWAIVV